MSAVRAIFLGCGVAAWVSPPPVVAPFWAPTFAWFVSAGLFASLELVIARMPKTRPTIAMTTSAATRR